jgi:hypothetical protein
MQTGKKKGEKQFLKEPCWRSAADMYIHSRSSLLYFTLVFGARDCTQGCMLATLTLSFTPSPGSVFYFN